MRKHFCGQLGETSAACAECDVIRNGETIARQYDLLAEIALSRARDRERIKLLEAALHCGSLACTKTDQGRCFCTCLKCVLARGDVGGVVRTETGNGA